MSCFMYKWFWDFLLESKQNFSLWRHSHQFQMSSQYKMPFKIRRPTTHFQKLIFQPISPNFFWILLYSLRYLILFSVDRLHVVTLAFHITISRKILFIAFLFDLMARRIIYENSITQYTSISCAEKQLLCFK